MLLFFDLSKLAPPPPVYRQLRRSVWAPQGIALRVGASWHKLGSRNCVVPLEYAMLLHCPWSANVAMTRKNCSAQYSTGQGQTTHVSVARRAASPRALADDPSRAFLPMHRLTPPTNAAYQSKADLVVRWPKSPSRRADGAGWRLLPGWCSTKQY